MMLAAMGLDEAAAAAAAPSRKRERADEPAEPSRRSGRNAGKEIFYGDAPHQTPISALITASVATLGERAAHGLPWPTLAQLVRPSLLEDPRLDQAFSLVRSATQTLLKAGKLRRSLLSLAEEQAKALELKPGDPRRTRTALRVLTIRTLQVSPSHLGEWDVALKDEPSEEETAAAREAAADRAHQRVIALEQKLREGAENTMDLAEGRYNTEEEIQHKLADARETAEAQAEAPPTPWTPAPDLLPELHSGGAGGGGGGSGTAAANDSDDDWEEEEKEPALDPDASPGCRVELMTSATTIRSRMRRNCETDATFFSLPPGWTRVPDESRTGRRRTQMVYSRLPDASDADEMDEDQEEEDIELNRATMTKVLRLMKELKAAECAWAFLDPVAVDDVPGYADVVATPMDLTTVQNKLDSGAHYFTLNALAADLRLIPANCIKFNAGVAGAEEYVQTALAFERQVERQLAIVRGADENAGVVRNRTDLEDILEVEWKKEEEEESEEAAGPWLGHVVNGKWEIRSSYIAEALESIVEGLVDDGLVIGLDVSGGTVLDAASSPKKQAPSKKKPKGRKGKKPAKAAPAKPKPKVDGYVCANRYTLGESFKVRNARLAAAAGGAEGESGEKDEEEDEEEEELNEYERERQQNILRNQAFLASLGLA